MGDLSKPLTKLGATVSDAAERLTDPADLDAARRMWLQSLGPRPLAPGPRWGLRSYALLFAAACMVALFVFSFSFTLGRRAGGRVSFVVGAPPVHGAVGEWVAADHDARLPMVFSEGTSFTLAPGATARVTETTAHGATLLLERGHVTAVVIHASAETRWGLRAGPFEVRVTGTKFDAGWDPIAQTFDLAMQDGVVVVKGPLLEAGRELRGGEVLRASVRDATIEVRVASAARVPDDGGAAPKPPLKAPEAAATVRAPSPAAPAASPPEPSTPSPGVTPVTMGGDPPKPPAQPAQTSPGRERASSWRDLAATGKYNEALAAAERAGFAAEIEHASSQDLAALAEAARYAARPSLARQALLAQRRRFGARGSSAFLLGKIAADQQGATADAVRWFETYLQEEPNGSLAEQALGRVLLLRKGEPAAARATAERYLARYPNGVHAPLARSMLSP